MFSPCRRSSLRRSSKLSYRRREARSLSPVAPTSDLQAHDLYLLGRAAQESRVEMPDAVNYLERAVQADPNYAQAHAALSRALVLWDFYQWVPTPPDALRRAEASAYRALSIDPQSSEAHAALGTVFRSTGNLAGAASEYKRALEINPNNAVALWDFIVLLDDDSKTKKETTPLIERLTRLDPRSPILWQSRVFDGRGLGGRRSSSRSRRRRRNACR